MNSIEIGNREYSFDNSDAEQSSFFQRYKEKTESSDIAWRSENHSLRVIYERYYDEESYMKIEAEGPNVGTLESLLEVFEKYSDASEDDTLEISSITSDLPKVFLGHGRSKLWRELKDHLADHHGFEVVAFESGSRAGHTIRDILDEMAIESNIAFLVMTAEDEMADGSFQARPNVIHEAGLFQGKPGFSRGIIVLEEGCSDFSNIHGIQQIRFSKGNIREAFGDIIAAIKREFDAAR
jgi:predicted nucleotide-binding protein